MKSNAVLFAVGGLLLSTPVFATGGPGGGTPFAFEFRGNGGNLSDVIPGEPLGISVFTITMDPPQGPVDSIVNLELELRGLTHEQPSDLNIYLIDPFGELLEIMTDRGDALPVVAPINMIFNDDTGIGLPPLAGPLTSGTFLPEGTPGFERYVKQSGGTDAWVLLVIDDSVGDSGHLNEWYLRGTGVPEPMTLSLLALGGLAFVVRRRTMA